MLQRHSRTGSPPFLGKPPLVASTTKGEKALYIDRVFAAVDGIIGPLAPASYIVIHDVRGDSWGYPGETQETRYVRGKAL